jgi:glycogen synthase
MYPPHHLGGYELVWQGAVQALRAAGHGVRVLTTDVRFRGVDAAGEDDNEVFRELRWYWRDHRFPRLSPWTRRRLERDNAQTLWRHLGDFGPDVVAWWSMGGMSLSLIAQAAGTGVRSAAFVHDDWLVYGPKVDQSVRACAQRDGVAARATALARAFAGRDAAAGRATARARAHAVAGRDAAVGRATARARAHAVAGRDAAAARATARTGVPTRVDWRGVDRWVFVSETTRRRAVAAVGDLGATEVAPSGIDPAFLAPAPVREWGWRLLCVGRLDPRKGVDTAVAALTVLDAGATLVLAGGGDRAYERRLRARISELGVGGRVELLGGVGRARLLALYAAADAFVFPVVWEEPWGLVPLEAMGRGVPVVATGRGGSGEYLRDGDNCLLFTAGDAAALAGALHRLADDPGLRARLRDGGLATASQHTAPRFEARAVAVLEEVAGG